MYKLNNTTYKHIVKDNPKDRLEVVIGDDKRKDFIPQHKIQRWDNECNVSIRLKHNEKNPTVEIEGEKIKWKGDKIEAHFYRLGVSEQHPEDANEFEVILKEKPKSNVIEFTLQDKDVDYFYQPELTQKEKDDGASRPENVIGSYAVYAKTPKTNWVGGKEYKCGKVGHIFRPKIIDSAGTEVWGELHIENGILSVTIPQDFLDKAVYPIRHAAGLTFGYTGHGTQSANFNYAQVILNSTYRHTAVTGETIVSFSVYFYGTTQPISVAAYTVVSNAASARLANPVDITGGGDPADWYTTGAVSQSLTNNVVYTVAAVKKAGDAYATYFYYDTGSADSSGDSNSGYVAGLANPWSQYTTYTRIPAIYATYTASGNTTTDKTLTGKARITKTVDKTLLGKSRVTVKTDKTLLGKSRITIKTDKTLSGKSRITAKTNKTLTGKANIAALTKSDKTLLGVSRITAKTNKTLLGKAKILVLGYGDKTLMGKARITAKTNKTLLGKGRIQITTDKTLLGKSRITAVTNKTLTGKASISSGGHSWQTKPLYRWDGANWLLIQSN